MAEKKAVRIEIEYDNGEVWRAVGDAAEKILRYWQGGEVINAIHGAKYQGPVLQQVRGADS